MVTKEEIAQNEQFLLLPQCYPLSVIGYPFNYRDFLFFDKIFSKSSAAELSMRERFTLSMRERFTLSMRERFTFFIRRFQGHLLQISCMWERVNLPRI